jgi:hypothetical protein
MEFGAISKSDNQIPSTLKTDYSLYIDYNQVFFSICSNPLQ